MSEIEAVLLGIGLGIIGLIILMVKLGLDS